MSAGALQDLALRFAVAFWQMHLLGVLYVRLFRPDEAGVVFQQPETAEGGPCFFRAVTPGRLAAWILPPVAAGLAVVVFPGPGHFAASPPEAGAWILILVAAMAGYLYLTRRSYFLREDVPTAVLLLALLGLSESTVHFLLDGPSALAGVFQLRAFGLALERGSVVTAVAGGPLEQLSALMLDTLLIVAITSAQYLASFPKRIRPAVLTILLGAALTVLAPSALLLALPGLPLHLRPFLPYELFLLLSVAFVGVILCLAGMELLRVRDAERRRLEEREAELAAQRFYNQQMQPFVETLRRQRHDLDNGLAMLAGLVRARDIPGLDAFVADKITGKTAHDARLAPIDTETALRIHSAALLGLLSAKAAEARDRNVRFTLAVDAEVADLPVPVLPLCQVLGILLDNALEAAAGAPQPLVQLRIGSCADAAAADGKGSLSFRVANTFAQAPDLDRLSVPGYSTKGEGRGRGLSIVRDRLRVLKGVQLATSLEGGWFAQELLLPVSPAQTASDAASLAAAAAARTPTEPEGEPAAARGRAEA